MRVKGILLFVLIFSILFSFNLCTYAESESEMEDFPIIKEDSIVKIPEDADIEDLPIVCPFLDISKSEFSWAYDGIIDMYNKGYFVGVSQADGSLLFNPNARITCAEFITVITRMLYSEDLSTLELEPIPCDIPWYVYNYSVAKNKGLIRDSEYDLFDLDISCSRQEMAMFLVRALEEVGIEVADNLVDVSGITDFDSIDSKFQDYVLKSYSKGLIYGMSDGSFAPLDTLTRAQAATVLYRISNILNSN